MTSILKQTEVQRLKAALNLRDQENQGLRRIVRVQAAKLDAIEAYLQSAEGEPTTEAIRGILNGEA